MRNIKKVAAIQDMSGLGRCSLTVIIPVLSAMGIQVCPVPTAVLSAHTGYGEFVMHDLTDFMVPVLEHYKKLKVDFDCIYSGFLASAEQIDHCLEFFRAFPDSLKLVDPVMGDDGRAYATYTKELCDRMSELVAVADIITPNLTEAAILLGEQYPKNAVSLDLIKKWLVRLSEMGAGIVVITSVMLEDGNMSTVGYNKADGSFWRLNSKIVPAHYSGTGDMFASVLIGSILKGDDLAVAMNRAGDFTEHSVRVTYRCKKPWTDGLMFESELGRLFSDRQYNDCVRI